jgi:succinyl-diaminopimelate desuccinylase
MTVNEILEQRQNEMLAALQSLVAIPSVEGPAEPGKPFGAECARALERALDLARSLGLRTGAMDGYVGWCECGAGDELLCVLTHLDVVPAGDGWVHEPFGGELDGGRIYGRGTVDDKGPAVAALYAMAALADSGTPLRRRVRLLFGLNEETGCACVKHYVDCGGELPRYAFTPDGEFPIINGEKGIYQGTFTRKIAPSARGIVSLRSGSAANVVPAGADCVLNFAPTSPLPGCAVEGARVAARGRGAHASTPAEGVNAISVLAEALANLELDGDSGALVRFLRRIDTRGERLGIACADALSGPLTLNAGLLSVENGEASLTLDLRCPVTKPIEPVLDILRGVLAAAGFTERSYKLSPGIYTPPESPLVQALQRVYKRETGQEGALLSIGGGTYAKTMPNCVAFGPIFPGQPMLDHQPEEFISVEDLMQNARLYAAAMEELANEPHK